MIPKRLKTAARPVKRRISRLLTRLAGTENSIHFVDSTAQGEEALLIAGEWVSEQDISLLKEGRGTVTTLKGKAINITDPFWHLHSLKEIFGQQVYRFRSDSKSPYILDCGANIGLSAIYFKHLFANARIIAFEPDERICGMLRNNLRVFGYNDVVIEQKAIWVGQTEQKFLAAGSLGGRIASNGDESDSGAPVVKVDTVRLRDYLDEKVDFLKMDIEGPEVEVLLDSADRLKNVQNLFVEYHSNPDKVQELDVLLSVLKKADFRVYLKEAWNNLPFPFLREQFRPCYDLQLNIFAYRLNSAVTK